LAVITRTEAAAEQERSRSKERTKDGRRTAEEEPEDGNGQRGAMAESGLAPTVEMAMGL
jgi:DNA invertase Pin-like site-specific DNA recombinase